MARNKKANGTTVINAVSVRRKPKKGETMNVGGKVFIQNNGNIGSQTIVNLRTVDGDLYL